MKLTGSRCKCAGCGEHFNSVSIFDKHRAGSYSLLERRCLSAAEMLAKGYTRNNAGFWISNPRPDRAPRRRDLEQGDVEVRVASNCSGGACP